MNRHLTCLLTALCLAGAAALAGSGDGISDGFTNAIASALPSTHVHHLFRATTNVFSGNSPDSDAAFAEIVRLGVKDRHQRGWWQAGR